MAPWESLIWAGLEHELSHVLPVPAGAHRQAQGGKCVYLFLGLGKVGEIPLFLG